MAAPKGAEWKSCEWNFNKGWCDVKWIEGPQGGRSLSSLFSYGDIGQDFERFDNGGRSQIEHSVLLNADGELMQQIFYVLEEALQDYAYARGRLADLPVLPCCHMDICWVVADYE